MKKTVLLSILAGFLYTSANAQQKPLFTQFAYNKLAFNPGYAGDFESPEIIAVNRNQMIGIPGAPNTQGVSFSTRLVAQRLGVGLSLQHHSIGITKVINVNAAFAYRIIFRRGVLSAALEPSFGFWNQNWGSEKVNPAQSNDPALPTEPGSKMAPTINAGMFYHATKGWYVGGAIYNLLKSSIDLSDIGNINNPSDFSRLAWHLNFMGGKTFWLNNEISFTPQAMFRYAFYAPPDGDLNMTAVFKRKLHAGMNYRAGGDGFAESVGLMFGLQATEKLFFCTSYDIPMTALRSKGAFEITVRWWTNPPATEDDVQPF